jgi:hypothetical protein
MKRKVVHYKRQNTDQSFTWCKQGHTKLTAVGASDPLDGSRKARSCIQDKVPTYAIVRRGINAIVCGSCKDILSAFAGMHASPIHLIRATHRLHIIPRATIVL